MTAFCQTSRRTTDGLSFSSAERGGGYALLRLARSCEGSATIERVTMESKMAMRETIRRP